MTLHCGDALTVLRTLPSESVQTCICSPPYWGLRDYGTAAWESGEAACDHIESVNGMSDKNTLGRPEQGGMTPANAANISKTRQYRDLCGKCGARRIDQQIGLEATPEQYVATLVEVFREVRRVLRDDGTLWLNLGDSYATGAGRVGECPGGGEQGERWKKHHMPQTPDRKSPHANIAITPPNRMPIPGLKPKDLVGIPWRCAFALQTDGWYLRSDIIWAKPNPMPESVTDRPTRAHEYLFLLAKSERYFYDAIAIAERSAYPGDERHLRPDTRKAVDPLCIDNGSRARTGNPTGETRNKRSVWTVATQPYPEAHFATFPPDLIKPCVLAGTSERGGCQQCGAPWERVTERDGIEVARGNEPHLVARGVGRSGNGLDRDIPTHYKPTITTLGWRPTCAHDAPTVPQTVLDPFAGAGTTLYVAKELGRRYVGIELNPAYIALAEARMRQEVLPL